MNKFLLVLMMNMLLGSGAEQVIRLSPIPVLVIRTPEQAPAPAQAGQAGADHGVA